MASSISAEVPSTIGLQCPDAWGERILSKFPAELRDWAFNRWVEVGNTGPKHDERGYAPHARANLELGRLRREFEDTHFDIGTSETEIAETAFKAAHLCGMRCMSGEGIAAHFGITLRWRKNITEDGKARRFVDPAFWRRAFRREYGRAIENMLRTRGLVRRGKAVYVSDWALRRRRSQRARARETLEHTYATNEEGTELTLLEVSSHSVSNPPIRRGEMMTRARGFEELARDAGHTWKFCTLTTPSAYHAQLEAGGANPRYLGFTVSDAQAWLNQMWSRARADFKRLGLVVYGFRVAEPHHDGTPHWHVLLFAHTDHIDRVEQVIRTHWLSEYQDESGAREARVKFVNENPSRGDSSAAGYIAKYIGKNIDGAHVGEDLESGLDAVESSERVEAWASLYGIRQFQQIGGPQVGIWRELRRLRDEPAPADIEPARAACDEPDWAGFVEANGGIGAGRAGSLQLWKADSAERNRYGERKGPIVVGVRTRLNRIRTRLHTWRIEIRRSMSVRFLPWTRVNNCTALDSSAGTGRRLQADIEPTWPANLDGSCRLDPEIVSPRARLVPAIAGFF
jgi:hypothetical protein